MSKARILVVYYSRSGVTARRLMELASRLDADIEEIADRADRSGQPKPNFDSIANISC